MHHREGTQLWEQFKAGCVRHFQLMTWKQTLNNCCLVPRGHKGSECLGATLCWELWLREQKSQMLPLGFGEMGSCSSSTLCIVRKVLQAWTQCKEVVQTLTTRDKSAYCAHLELKFLPYWKSSDLIFSPKEKMVGTSITKDTLRTRSWSRNQAKNQSRNKGCICGQTSWFPFLSLSLVPRARRNAQSPQGQWLPATAQAAPKLPAGRAGDFSQLPFSQWLKFFMEFSSINQLSIFKSLGPRTFSERFACQPCSKEWELSLPFRNLSSDSAMGSSLQRSPELPRPTPGTLFQQPHFCWQMLTSLENDSFTFNFCFPKALIPGYQVIDGTWVHIPYSVRVQEKQLSSSFPCPVRCAGTTDVASITSQRAEVTPSPTPEPALPALFPINGSVLTEGRHWYSHLVFEYESLQSSL